MSKAPATPVIVKATVPVKATNTSIVTMKVGDIKYDPVVQRRTTNYTWAQWLADNWNDMSCGVITVSERANGDRIVLDGNHRRIALVDDLGLPDWPVQVEVLTGLTLQQEAQEFIDRNRNRKGVAAYDLYCIDLVAGTPDALVLERAVAVAGFAIERKAALPNKIGAINTLRSITRKSPYGGDALERALKIVATCMSSSAWGGDTAALGAEVVGGLTILVIDNPTMEDDKMADRLSSLLLRTLIDSTKQAMSGSGGEISRAKAFARVAAGQYNRGRIARKRIDPPARVR